MGSPTIFNGQFTKLLTSRGIVRSDGGINEYDGPYNYISNSSFEQSITSPSGPTLFNTTLTSGLPTGSISAGAASLALSLDTSTPILGNGSLQCAAGTTWTAGQGFYFPTFTVQPAHLGQVLTWSFSYKVISGGSNANWSGILGSQTLMVYIYDVTNSAWVQPAGFLGMNQNSGAGVCTGTFQSSVTANQQYRLVVMASQASSGALTIDFDNFYLGPQTAPIGAVATDWVSFTPSWTATGTNPSIGNGTISGRYRRVGDSAQIQIYINSGTTTAYGTGTWLFGSTPTGLSADNTKVNSLNQVLGMAVAVPSGGTNYSGEVSYQGSTVSVVGPSTTAAWSPTVPASFASSTANQIITLNFTIPIAGWSSNVQTSDSTDTRVVAVEANVQTPTNTPATNTVIKFGTIAKDTHAGYNVSTGLYTVPVSGFYKCLCTTEISATWTVGEYYQVAVFYNGSGVAYGAGEAQSTSVTKISASVVHGIYCNAGDTLGFYIGALQPTSPSFSAVLSGSNFYISRESGPSVIVATESVNAAYNTSTQNVNNTTATISYTTKSFDSHNAYSSGTYTIPVSGKYWVGANIELSPISVGTSSTDTITITKNGGAVIRSLYPGTGGAASQSRQVSGVVTCNAGDTITIQYNTALNETLDGNAQGNYFSIERVGN